MKFLKKAVVVICLLALTVSVCGCSEEGPMEKAGKKMDQAAQDASDAVHDAADKAKKIFE